MFAYEKEKGGYIEVEDAGWIRQGLMVLDLGRGRKRESKPQVYLLTLPEDEYLFHWAGKKKDGYGTGIFVGRKAWSWDSFNNFFYELRKKACSEMRRKVMMSFMCPLFYSFVQQELTECHHMPSPLQGPGKMTITTWSPSTVESLKPL